MTIEENKLFGKEIIRTRLNGLKEAWSNLAIEDLHVPADEKKFLEDMVRQGLTENQITQKINQRFING